MNEQANEVMKVYEIPSDNLGNLEAKFQKLGKRARKLGLPEPTYTEVGEPTRNAEEG